MAEKKDTKQKEASVLEKTLLREDFQGIVGSNYVKLHYGKEAGEDIDKKYSSIMNGEKINEIRSQYHEEQKARYKSKGIAGEPSYLSHSDLSLLVAEQIDQVMLRSKLGKLYSVIKKVAPKLDIKISDKIKDMTMKELEEIMVKKNAITKDGKLDLNKLSKEEQSAYLMYNTLSDAYREISGANLIGKTAYEKYNEKGKVANDILEPKDEEGKLIEMKPDNGKSDESDEDSDEEENAAA